MLTVRRAIFRKNFSSSLLCIIGPPDAGKEPFEEEILSVGGQVASAVVTCQRLGLQTKYVGTVGDDDRGAIQIASLREEGVNIDDVQVREGSATQSAYIVIDRETGERTVFWRREEGLRRPRPSAPAPTPRWP